MTHRKKQTAKEAGGTRSAWILRHLSTGSLGVSGLRVSCVYLAVWEILHIIYVRVCFPGFFGCLKGYPNTQDIFSGQRLVNVRAEGERERLRQPKRRSNTRGPRLNVSGSCRTLFTYLISYEKKEKARLRVRARLSRERFTPGDVYVCGFSFLFFLILSGKFPEG
ncbi:hypothetical protein F5Y11DRAFT_320110 [Daldinia sp. FL1419]|nr:hypothetical protein F5Y11DRAFT_320110 [Daldinia sp. FL1419]